MLLTICTIRQLAQAFVLGDSFSQFAGTDSPEGILIGLVDDPNRLPSGFTSPYPVIPVKELLPAEELIALSAQYSPTEFAAACKPLFIKEAFRRYPETNRLVYADPNIQFLALLTPIWEQLSKANILLTPFINHSPSAAEPHEKGWPDEKFYQNIGLYSADFLVFRRSAETGRMLDWWDDRVRTRAYINFCDGLCLDQTWLMHIPVFFREVGVIKNPGWHVGIWNLPERTLTATITQWFVSGPTGPSQLLLFFNFKGLQNRDEGFFPHQTRVRIENRPHVSTLLNKYRQLVDRYKILLSGTSSPAYGLQPQPVVLRGWRHTTVASMRKAIRFLDRVYLPAIR